MNPPRYVVLPIERSSCGRTPYLGGLGGAVGGLGRAVGGRDVPGYAYARCLRGGRASFTIFFATLPSCFDSGPVLYFSPYCSHIWRTFVATCG